MSEYRLSWCDRPEPPSNEILPITPSLAAFIGSNLSMIPNISDQLPLSANVRRRGLPSIGPEIHDYAERTDVNSLSRRTDSIGGEVTIFPETSRQPRFINPGLIGN